MSAKLRPTVKEQVLAGRMDISGAPSCKTLVNFRPWKCHRHALRPVDVRDSFRTSSG
jgi:hypothetical protein